VTGPGLRIEPMAERHAAAVLAIYQAGIDEGNATFETRAPAWAEFSVARLPGHRYVALDGAPGPDGETAPKGKTAPKGETAPGRTALPGMETAPGGAAAVLGWVAVSAVSSRCAYAGVVEHSVYVHPDARGRGVGRRLLDALIASTEAAGIWTIQSGIFPENTASVALHRAAGFRVVGTRERISQHHGRWRDVVLLERRSPVI
jgi:L-amino acid N-acyltransferase YncA